jgi:hypothetical protein
MNRKISSASLSLIAIMLLAIQSSAIAVSPNDSLMVPVFGKVYIYNRTNTAQNVVIMISGDGGWKSGVTGFPRHFRR